MRIVLDGVYYAAGLALAGVVLAFFLGAWLLLPFALLALFCLYFFRDPERISPPGESIVSPADGTVVSIKDTGDGETRISIFLNIFNVHVNRSPISGEVTEVTYRPGRFLVASREAASVENEQNTLVIQGQSGRVVCRQIAGLIARRIICYKQRGDHVTSGERIGYIKFGSRVDVIFGPQWRTAVRLGQSVAAGSSVLAQPISPGAGSEVAV